MKSFTQGRSAEAAVAENLKGQGYEILGQNWRRPRCEIDIIARKQSVVYFIEVKFRSSPEQGNGFDYITPKKLKQMNLAANIWLAESNLDCDWRLMAAAVDGGGAIELVEI